MGSAVVGLEWLSEVGDVQMICFAHDNERDMQQVMKSALVVGMMLGVAGPLIQRLIGNPMASPEVLGICSGAVVMMFFVPGNAVAWLLLAATLTIGPLSFVGLMYFIWLLRRS